MSRSECLACGTRSVAALILPPDAASAGQTCVHTCRLCGDQRVSIWDLDGGHAEQVNIHAHASGPEMRQVGRVVVTPDGRSEVEWAHYIDGVEVPAAYWQVRLEDRRALCRAKVFN